MNKLATAGLCMVLLLLAAMPIAAQETTDCKPDAINATVDNLVKVYQIGRNKSDDTQAALDKIASLEADLAKLRDNCAKAQTTASSPSTETGNGSESSPYAFGVAGDTFANFSLQLSGLIRNADRTIHNENMFNDRPDKDEVYIIINLDVVCNKQATGSCEAQQFNFKLLGDMGIIYEAPYIVYDKMINVKVVKGTKAKGDIVFKIKKDDTNLRLLFTASLIGDDYVYYYAEPSLAGGIQVSSTAAVNIRSGAGKNFDVTGSLPANTPATAFGRSADGSWLQIPEGWVFSTLVKTDGDINTLPVTAQ